MIVPLARRVAVVLPVLRGWKKTEAPLAATRLKSEAPQQGMLGSFEAMLSQQIRLMFGEDLSR